jgi:hypothetical protein
MGYCIATVFNFEEKLYDECPYIKEKKLGAVGKE